MVVRFANGASSLFALSALVSGCGLGTAGIVAGTSGSGGGSNAATVGSDLAVTNAAGDARPVTSPAYVSFLLTDQEGDVADCQVFFDAGSGEREITLASGSRPLTGIPSGAPYTVRWDFAADMPTGESYRDDVVLRLSVLDGISPPALPDVELGNDPPAILSATISLPAGVDEARANTDVEFVVVDTAGDPVSVRVQYNCTPDFPEAEWMLARPASTPALEPTPDHAFVNLSTTATGVPETFVWNSAFDLPGGEVDVRVRFTADDGFEAGAPTATPAFRVDNNAPPLAIIEDGLLLTNADETRAIGIPFRLLDAESDPIRVVFQWRRPEQSWGDLPLPATPDEIQAVLADPDRRRALQICTEKAPSFTGRLAPPPGLLDPTHHVSLPDLTATATSLLVRGVDGRTLEILRASKIPEPVAGSWPSNPLENPVAALAIGGGPTGLVLDAPSGGSWRLREIDLANGKLVGARVATGLGRPTAMDYEPEEEAVVVASDLGGVWRLDRVDLQRWTVATLVSALDGSTETGPIRGIATLGTGASLITVGSSLIRVEYPTDAGVLQPDGASGAGLHRVDAEPLDPSRAVTLLGDLETPWGIVPDPLRANRIYLAERDAAHPAGSGRVSTLELDTYAREPVFVVPGAPGEGLERPTAIALERNGARLLAVTDTNPGDGRLELRGVDLGGAAPGVVFEITATLPGEASCVSVGPGELRLVTLSSPADLAIGGGVQQRRTLVDYEATTLTVEVVEPFDPAPSPNAIWRVESPSGFVRSSPTGASSVFVWDSTDVPEGEVHLRIVPFDTDVGLEDEGLAKKRVRLFDEPFSLGDAATMSGPLSVEAADLNDDGMLDLVSSNGISDNLTIFYQDTPGVFSAIPDVVLISEAGSGPRTVVAAHLNDDDRLDLAVANVLSADVELFFQPEGGFQSGSRSDCRLEPGTVPITFIENVHAADLNGDGRLDLFTGGPFGPSAGHFDGAILVFFQDLTLDPVCPFPRRPDLLLEDPSTIRFPNDLTSADIDGDGRIDLVSPNLGNFDEVKRRGFVTMFLQGAQPAAPGQFPLERNRVLELDHGAHDVAAADLNGDGRLDVCAASRPGFAGSPVEGEHALAVFFQSTSGAFAERADLVLADPANMDAPGGLVAADIDADGRLDLAAANLESDNVTVFAQASRGRFRSAADIVLGQTATTTRPFKLETADLDGDGRLDLITSNADDDELTVFLQSAPGALSSAPDLELGTSAQTDRPESVAVGDLNSDGLFDLASVNRESDDVTVFLQQSPGQFHTEPDIVLGDASTTEGPRSGAAADLLGGDGHLDLVSANFDGNTLTIFRQTNPGVFDSTPITLQSPGRPLSLAAADLDGDGDLDLVSANRAANRLRIFYQPFVDGASAVVSLGGDTTGQPFSVVAADLDGDGDQDLVSTNRTSNNLTIFVQPNGGFAAHPGPPDIELLSGAEPRSVVAEDLDDDGDLDLASASFVADDLRVFLQPPLGFSTGSVPDSVLGSAGTTNGPRSVDAVDLDLDGDVDLVSANLGSLSVFLQNSPGRYPDRPSRTLGGTEITDSPACVIAADLNGDGEPDLAAALHKPIGDFGNFFDTVAIFFGGN